MKPVQRPRLGAPGHPAPGALQVPADVVRTASVPACRAGVRTAAAAPGAQVHAAAQPTRYSSAQLFGAEVEVEIEHRAQVYRLRRTAMGKLILTK